ncbi:MAG TPA: hypothetical protein VIN59_04175 [Alphaproteobacteria bacterium]
MVALHTIDPSRALFDGADMLKAASAMASGPAPIAPDLPRNGTVRLATGVRRGPIAPHRRALQPRNIEQMAMERAPGVRNTQYWRTNDVSARFNPRAANVERSRKNAKLYRANALLMAASGLQSRPAPTPQYLDALSRRAYAKVIEGTLRGRFNMNGSSLVDKIGDTAAQIQAQSMGYTPQQIMTM